MGTMVYFRNSCLVTIAGLMLGLFVGWHTSGTLIGALSTVFIVAVLAILEVSLSFDNAVVNATVLKEMSPVWRRRFLTWGIAIAVFGMRIVFPLIIVAIVARIDPFSALVMATTDPDHYSRVLTSAHISVAAFGGAFLAMVGLKHFFNHEKDVHWIAIIERPLTRLGRIEAVELGLVLLLLYIVSKWLSDAAQVEFLVAGIFGVVTYIAVDGISAVPNGTFRRRVVSLSRGPRCEFQLRRRHRRLCALEQSVHHRDRSGRGRHVRAQPDDHAGGATDARVVSLPGTRRVLCHYCARGHDVSKHGAAYP